MANEYIHDTRDTIHEGDSYTIRFRFINAITGNAIVPSSQKVFITELESSDKVNGRDGTYVAGLTVTDTNLVTFRALPADAVLVTSWNSEVHKIRIELKYNGDVDVDNRIFLMRVDRSVAYGVISMDCVTLSGQAQVLVVT